MSRCTPERMLCESGNTLATPELLRDLEKCGVQLGGPLAQDSRRFLGCCVTGGITYEYLRREMLEGGRTDVPFEESQEFARRILSGEISPQAAFDATGASTRATGAQE